MAIRKTSKRKKEQEPTIPPLVNSKTGISLLRKLIEKAEEILKNPGFLKSSDLKPWETTARDYLVRAFGSESPNVKSVLHAHGDGGIWTNMSDFDFNRYLRSGMQNKIKILNSCIELLETEVELSKEETISSVSDVLPSPETDRVFIVHGHDHGLKESVARFVEKLGLDPVILHEKANAGRTIIEKFSDYSDVHFAVVLLTADDEGKSKDSSDPPKFRARQNVILELGYFLGKLGRERVCALYQKDVEIPSDYSGVLFVPLDSKDRWKFDLVKELKAAGFQVDANRIYSDD